MTLSHYTDHSPFELFSQWYQTAQEDDPEYFCGMQLATVSSEGKPSLRVVLMRAYDEQGFIFYTNYHSVKGQQIDNNQNVAATFWWSQRQRQIRIEGCIEKVENSLSDNYFHQRPTKSQIAAITSQQSQPIDSFSELEKNFQETFDQLNNTNIQRPEYWGGYRIKPVQIEFWQGMNHRLHQRLLFTKTDKEWKTSWLQP